MKYNLVNDGDRGNITVFVDGEMYVATNEHPSWSDIVSGVVAGDEGVVALFDPSATAAKKFERLSDRVTVANGRVYLDGDEMHNALTDQILRFIREGEDFEPLVRFYENLLANPNEHSREQLYRWLQTHDFTITPDGNFIGYKGVRVDENGNYTSVSKGPATVNGEEVNGYVPNPLGAVVEMPRSEVQHDPSVGCHTGLHVGTWDYANGFARGAVLKVEVNPRDVVSVPTDCGDAKVRCCRYTVLEVTEQQLTTPVWGARVNDDPCGFDDDEDWDDEDDSADDEDDYSPQTGWSFSGRTGDNWYFTP